MTTADPDTISPRWGELRRHPVRASTWLDLARDYAQRELPWQAAYAARQAARLDPSFTSTLDRIGVPGWRDAGATGARLGSAALDGADDLEQRFHEATRACPGDWLSWLYLARLHDIARANTAPPPISQAQLQAETFEPIAGETLHWLGVWRLAAGDAGGAVAALAGLANVRPLRHGSMMYLGEALLRTNRRAAAEKAFECASLSDSPDFLLTLSAKVFSYNYWQEAMGVLHKALVKRPDSIPHLLALASIQSDSYHLQDCRATVVRILELDPDNLAARAHLAALAGRMGDAKGQFDTLQAQYEAAGDPLSRLASSIAMVALYQDELQAADVAALHSRLCAPIEAACSPSSSGFLNTRDPERKLRIGYVTGDLHRQHPVNLFMLPVLLRHDHARFEISVYHTGTLHDEYTRRARRCCDRWTEAATMSDTELRRAVAHDGIDILVDLGGHTSTHRLGVFAQRAAPVQASFLGYPHSTGLSTIDWLVGDSVVSPREHASLFCEGIAQLPGAVFCWAPVDAYPLPAARPVDAPLVFGSFNNTLKLSPKTIALWATVLRAVPGALLLLKAPSLRDSSVQARFTALFAAEGIAADRLVFRGPTGLDFMMQEYGDIDIALDPMPYNGGTTTLQALWMGVPVITMEGTNFVSRMGASFLRTLNRSEWIAHDAAGYVAAAVALANDRQCLRAGRARLREAMLASPLSDIDSFVRNFENLLRAMWTLYCKGDRRRFLGADDIASFGKEKSPIIQSPIVDQCPRQENRRINQHTR